MPISIAEDGTVQPRISVLPTSVLPASVTAATMTAPLVRDYILDRPEVVRATLANAANLTDLRTLVVGQQTANAPVVKSAPTKIERTVTGTDGTAYFVPQARLMKRSKVLDVPYVYLERRDGKVYLQARFELVRFASHPTKSKPLPIDGFSVALLGKDGNRIDFTRCDELPPSETDGSVLSQLFCETEVDLNKALGLLQSDQDARFKVEANVHYTQAGVSRADADRANTRIANSAASYYHYSGGIGRSVTAINPGGAVGRVAFPTTGAVSYRPSRVDPSPPKKKTRRLSLGAKDNRGVEAFFPVTNARENRAIYAQVTTGFGSEPWSEWVQTPNGRFMASPIPDQFYVLADDYRLAFDPATGMPAMEVLLVPPAERDPSAPTGFGSAYKFRCRFGIVPWLEPARVERLREEIADHSGVVHPELVVGGINSASCQLSRTYDSLGSSLVGEADASIDVDPLGFDLVVDCTPEFYRLLSRLLVTDGVTADVKTVLVGDGDHPPTETRPVLLRLDRPAFASLEAALIEPEPQPTGDGEQPGLEVPKLRVTNRSPYAATVERLSTTLLVVDETLPTAIGAVEAEPTPSGFTIPAADGATPSSIEVELAPRRSELPPLYGAVDVSFVGLSIDIDPQAVLEQVHDLGASADIFSTVEVRSYQLEHPDVLPDSHADVFGIEAQFRRGESDPITVFLTRDQPETVVQVSFSVADLVAGARPEQPKFSWRRRNMAGSGTGAWSDWEDTIGRQLFVSPVGL